MLLLYFMCIVYFCLLFHIIGDAPILLFLSTYEIAVEEIYFIFI